MNVTTRRPNSNQPAAEVAALMALLRHLRGAHKAEASNARYHTVQAIAWAGHPNSVPWQQALQAIRRLNCDDCETVVAAIHDAHPTV